MTLENWHKAGLLKSHSTSAEEIANLLAIVDRDIEESHKPGMGDDWRFNIAYNAILQAATAALRAAGYEPERQRKHYYAIQSLELTVRFDPEIIRLLEVFQKKRHQAEYDQAGIISDGEAKEIMAIAMQVSERVREWLRAEHPDLMK